MNEKPNNKTLTGQNISEYLKVAGEEAEIVNEDSNSSNNQKETQKPNENISQERTWNKQTSKKPNTKLELEMKEAINNQDVQQIDNILKEIADNDPNFKKALNGVNLAEKLNSKTLGKIVYHNFKKINTKKDKEFVNKIPNEYAFDATVSSGFHTFASWDSKKGNFYIESTRKLDKVIKEILKINPESNISTLLDKENPNQIIGKINNMTEDEFKKILLIGNEEAKKPLTENEIKIQKNNEEIAELDKKINELNKEIENMDTEIAKLQAMILALPDDEPEPTTQPQAINEPKTTEQISVNENGENKITSEDFKELVRLSKFFLENPKEPTTIGSIENKYPELFKEINKIEERKQDDLSTLISTDKNGKKYYAAFTELGNLYADTKEEIENKINSKYDAELAELEKTQVEKVEVDESERKKTERLAKSAAQSIAEGIIAMNSKENTKSVENSKIIRLEELKKEIQENINKLLENPEAKKFNPKILKFKLSRTEEDLNISTEVYLNNVPVIGDVTIKLNLDLGNENKNIIIKKHKISTDSFFATGKVKKTLEPLLPKLVPQIKSYLENKLGYQINTLKINKGDLYINS